jgi:hypothetical protein
MITWEGALEKKVMALTPDEVNSAFKSTVKADDLVIVKAGDFKKATAGPAGTPQ